ncbi:hypothetical protein KVR01_006239 [Diaporthe batatas]|uniref:uncharacterized protein n=1 Tax=Diaporthe batatas TaxID=748121 RepID=UPI001D03ED46|nr:uncharacterized protein KVR01_006239 [Diaporthe batatas]KAG8164321.1 hypothetical protein KVR01_006239 [Diaporthe batatas]
MTAAVEPSQPQLPSYNEALQWGYTPPPRVTWAPPREDSPSPRPRTLRPRASAVRPFSMSTIDESALNGRRPSTSSGGPFSPIGLDNILRDALRGASRTSDGPLSPASPMSPVRPSTAQPVSSSDLLTVPSSSPCDYPEPRSPAYSPTQEEFIPEPVPLHPRPPIPPGYSRHDPTAATYLLHSPLIYSSSGSSPQTPTYQLDARLSKAGRPYQLRIRQLDHLESRTLAFSRDPHRSSGRFLRYEEEHTLYLLQVMQLMGGFGVPGLGFGPSWRVEMHRDPNHEGSGTRGFIRFEGGGFLGMGKGFMRKSGCKFWYMTRKSDREREALGESKLSARYGYQPEFEWNRRLMFSVEKRRGALGLGGRSKGYEWKDGKGRVVAVESAEGRLDLSRVAASMSAHSRESLLACWVGKCWAAGALDL